MLPHTPAAKPERTLLSIMSEPMTSDPTPEVRDDQGRCRMLQTRQQSDHG
jgi:hypothetical protein